MTDWTKQGTTAKSYYTYGTGSSYWTGGTLSKSFTLTVDPKTPLDVYSLTFNAAGKDSINGPTMQSQEILLNVIAATPVTPVGNNSILAASASSVSLGRMLTGHLNSQTVTISRTSGTDNTGFTAIASGGDTATGLVNNTNGAITGSANGSVSVGIVGALGVTAGTVAIQNTGNNGVAGTLAGSAGPGLGNAEAPINIGVTGTVVANRPIIAGSSPIPARVLGGSTWAVSLSGTGSDTLNTMPVMNTSTSATLTPETGVSVKSLAGTFSSGTPIQKVVVSFAKNAVGLKNNNGLAINLAGQVSPEAGISLQQINNGTPVAFSYNTTVGSVVINPTAPTSYSGSPAVATLAAGSSYADLLSVTSPGTILGSRTLGTTATLLGGTSPTSGTAGVSMDWRNRTPDELRRGSAVLPPGISFLASDVLNLTTVSSGQTVTPFVLQMSYSPTLFGDGTGAASAASGYLYLGWLNGTAWENAGLSTQQGISGISDTPYLHGWSLAGDGDPTLTVGRWGVDTVNHVAWAVLDHNSEFAVVPEPSTLMLLLAAAGMAGMAWRRKQRSAT
ncbi:MAG: PEP-CTERM sorting domain-containing protein [Planctomycetota bacterium]